MRLEFDEQGYVCCILYGCLSGSCVEYTGLVPTQPEQYKDIDDWADRAQTQAYKLDAEGNLTYDSGRAEELAARPECVPNEYRTAETLVGKLWIDGKPIYRRVISGKVDSGKINTAVELNADDKIADLETVVCMNGTIKLSDIDEHLPLFYTFALSTGGINDIVVGIRKDGCAYVNSYRAGTVHMIVDYTKSTD